MTARICTLHNGGPCDTLMRNQRLAPNHPEAISDQICTGCQFELALPFGLDIGDQAIYWKYAGPFATPSKRPVLCTIIDTNLRSQTRQAKIEIDGDKTKWVASYNLTRRTIK